MVGELRPGDSLIRRLFILAQFDEFGHQALRYAFAARHDTVAGARRIQQAGCAGVDELKRHDLQGFILGAVLLEQLRLLAVQSPHDGICHADGAHFAAGRRQQHISCAFIAEGFRGIAER